MNYLKNLFYKNFRLKPKFFGHCWELEKHDVKWYDWMHESRISAHNDFLNYYKEEVLNNKKIKILEVGCGRHQFYKKFFSKEKYCGYDISKKNIDWCRKNNRNKLHSYKLGDIIEKIPEDKYHLVFSQGTIDNTYNINKFIDNCIQASSKHVYITAYRGWFDKLNKHRYSWNNQHKVFYNDISMKEVKNFLSKKKGLSFKIDKLGMKNTDIPFETRIIIKKTLNII